MRSPGLNGRALTQFDFDFANQIYAINRPSLHVFFLTDDITPAISAVIGRCSGCVVEEQLMISLDPKISRAVWAFAKLTMTK
jgi:hypothetical protein